MRTERCQTRKCKCGVAYEWTRDERLTSSTAYPCLLSRENPDTPVSVPVDGYVYICMCNCFVETRVREDSKVLPSAVGLDRSVKLVSRIALSSPQRERENSFFFVRTSSSVLFLRSCDFQESGDELGLSPGCHTRTGRH